MPRALKLRTHKFQAVFERHGGWYVGYVRELPGVYAEERTLSRARESLRIALQELAELDPKALSPRGRRIEELEVQVKG